MSPETWVAIAAAVVALVALFFTGMSAVATRSAAATAKAQTKIQEQSVRVAEEQTRIQQLAARTAMEQTEIQRQLRIDAVQPYVWADIRPDESVGVILNLVVGNSGPTVARNVRVTVDPPLPRIDQLAERVDNAETRLAGGLKSLAPGRRLSWPLGQGFNLLNDDGPHSYTFTVTADGPFGPVSQLTYVVDTSEWKGITDRPAGSLDEVTNAIKELTKKVVSSGRST
jgi:hypothetical protein